MNDVPQRSIDYTRTLRRRRIFWLPGVVLVLGGALLHVLLSSRFVFFHAAQYNEVALIVFFVLLPGCSVLLFWTDHMAKRLRIRFPTGWVRRLIVIPVTVAMVTGMVVIAPLGWLAVAVWIVGDMRAQIPATVVDVDKYVSKKGCDQYATLSIAAVDAKVCLADHYAGPALRPGQQVTLTAHTASIGLFIGPIAAH